MKLNRGAGVKDRWHKTIRDTGGNEQTVPSANNGRGSRWRARYVDDGGREHAKGFARKVDAQNWRNNVVSEQVTDTWTDPKLSRQTFGVLAEKWAKTKAPKTFAGYRSLLDVVVSPRWGDVPLRDVTFENLICRRICQVGR